LGYKVEVVKSISGLDNVVEKWRTFLEEKAEWYTFNQDPKVIRLRLLLDKENYSPSICIVQLNGEIKCIAPCYIHRTSFPLRFSIINIASPSVRLLRVYGGNFVFARNADKNACITAVLGAIKAGKVEFDLVWIQDLAVPGPLWNYFHESNVRKRFSFHMSIISPKMEKRHYLELPTSYEEWLGSLRSKTRQTMQRRTQRFKKQVKLPVELVRVTRPDQVHWFLDQVNYLFPLTWQANVYKKEARNSTQQITGFSEIAANGWLRSYVLMVGEQPIAFLVGYQYAGIYVFEEPGYGPKYTRLGPGSVLNHLMIEDLFQNEPPKVLDFGFGDNQYKRTFGNVVHDECSVYLVPPNRWWIMVSIQRGMNFFYTSIRFWLIKLGFDRQVRLVLRRGI
jgi:hypothetical protein